MHVSEYMKQCEHDADMVMLRALYLSWCKAVLETPAQKAFGILRFA